MLSWLFRFALALAAVGLIFLALGSSPTQQPAPTPVVVTPPPTAPPSAAPLPTATSEPFIERITSRIARATPGPFPTATPLPNGVARVSAVDFGYMPSVVRIRVGQTVIWRNDGREEHDVTGDDWHSGQMEPTVEYRQTFGFAGRFDYRCSIHPDMTGTVIVDP